MTPTSLERNTATATIGAASNVRHLSCIHSGSFVANAVRLGRMMMFDCVRCGAHWYVLDICPMCLIEEKRDNMGEYDRDEYDEGGEA